MARGALLTRLEAISDTARAIGQDTPGLEDKFQMSDHLTDQAILTAGRVFARRRGIREPVHRPRDAGHLHRRSE